MSMVLLRVVSKSLNQIHEIGELLLKEQLVIDVNIKKNIDRMVLEKNKVK